MRSPGDLRTLRPLVSIVVPTIGRTSRLTHVIAGLCQDEFQAPYEIVAVVDGSADLADGVSCADPRCVYQTAVATGRRVGVAAARNMGVAIARGAIIAFLDDDTIPCPGWMNQILRALDGGSVKAAVGLVDSPPVRTAVDRLRDIGYKGRHVANQQRRMGNMIARQGFGNRSDLTERHLVDYLSGGNCAVLRSVFMDVGGFDERLLVGQDRELGRRLMAAGYPVAYEPDMRVLHFNEGTLAKLSRGRFRSGYFNVLAREHRNPWKVSEQLGVTWPGLWRHYGPAVFFAALVSNFSYSSGRLRARVQVALGCNLMERVGQGVSASPLPFIGTTPALSDTPCRFLDISQPAAQRHGPHSFVRPNAEFL